MTSVGSVRSFDADEGWGVIDGPDVPGGCWVHFSAVAVDGYRQLAPGQRVSFRAEAASQDGFAYRALKVWTGDVEPADRHPIVRSSIAYRSSLTLTFDQPHHPGAAAATDTGALRGGAVMAQEPYAGLATTFDTAAELYERARPGYPGQLFVDLATSTGLHTGEARVLEVGAGTGKATRGLLERGWSVVALEPGRELAAVARRVLAGRGDVDVVESPFERWAPGGREPFDVVFAATSWHWLDPQVAYRRAAELLRPGGHLAIVATEHVSPAGGDEFFQQVQRVYDEVGLGDGQGGPKPPEAIAAPDVAAMVGSGFFAQPIVHRYVWSQDYTAEEYLAVLSTYSGHIAASAWQRSALFAGIRELIAARPSATVRKHYLNTLQIARRSDGAA